jgi:hypothetical protein
VNWQPISTALTDGTFVLLRGGTTSDFDVFDDELEDSTGRPVVAKWDGGRWVYAFWDGAWRSAYYSPTEWALIE